MIVVGTYEASLLIYNQKSEGLQLLREKKLSSIMKEELDMGVVPHSITVLYGDVDDNNYNAGSPLTLDEQKQNEPCFLLVGLRQGTLISFSLNSNSQELHQLLSDNTWSAVLSIGTCAIEFDTNDSSTIMKKNRDTVLAFSDRLWRIKYNSICPQLLEVEPVLLPNFTSSTSVESVISLVGTSMNQKIGQVVGVIADGYFHLLYISSKCSISTRKITIGEVRHRILIFFCTE